MRNETPLVAASWREAGETVLWTVSLLRGESLPEILRNLFRQTQSNLLVGLLLCFGGGGGMRNETPLAAASWRQAGETVLWTVSLLRGESLPDFFAEHILNIIYSLFVFIMV